MNKQKEIITGRVDELLPELTDIALDLYQHPEVGGSEKRTTAVLQHYLLKRGFEVTDNYYDYPYSLKLRT